MFLFNLFVDAVVRHLIHFLERCLLFQLVLVQTLDQLKVQSVHKKRLNVVRLCNCIIKIADFRLLSCRNQHLFNLLYI